MMPTRLVFRILLALCSVGSVGVSAYAEPTNEALLQTVSPSAETSGTASKILQRSQLTGRTSLDALVRKSIAAVAMLSVLGMACFLFHQWNQQKAVATDLDAPLKLISSLAIAPRCTVSLLQASGNAYLVARDATGIKHIVPVQKDFPSLMSEAESMMPLTDTQIDRLPPTPWTSDTMATNGKVTP